MKTLLYRIVAVTFLLLVGSAAARGDQQTSSIIAAPERALARDLLRELVEINTTPANGSTKAAEAMAARLRAAGFAESDILLLGPRPDRQNLVVRLHGRTKAKPILLIAHLDVVDAPREGWLEGLDPFQLTERNGFFYGRCVIDDKNAVGSGRLLPLPNDDQGKALRVQNRWRQCVDRGKDCPDLWQNSINGKPTSSINRRKRNANENTIRKTATSSCLTSGLGFACRPNRSTGGGLISCANANRKRPACRRSNDRCGRRKSVT